MEDSHNPDCLTPPIVAVQPQAEPVADGEERVALVEEGVCVR